MNALLYTASSPTPPPSASSVHIRRSTISSDQHSENGPPDDGMLSSLQAQNGAKCHGMKHREGALADEQDHDQRQACLDIDSMHEEASIARGGDVNNPDLESKGSHLHHHHHHHHQQHPYYEGLRLQTALKLCDFKPDGLHDDALDNEHNPTSSLYVHAGNGVDSPQMKYSSTVQPPVASMSSSSHDEESTTASMTVMDTRYLDSVHASMRRSRLLLGMLL
jgi:hypothetical protein